MKKLRAGLIGCGYWGKNLARVIDQSDHCDLAVICDSDEGRISALGEVYPDTAFTTIAAEVVNDPAVDFVVIATPVSSHYPLVEQALAAGKHVLCEKLLATEEAQVSSLQKMAESKGLVLSVAYTFLYNAVVRYMAGAIRQQRLGQLSFLTFKRTGLGPIRADVDVIEDLAAHDLSMLLYWMGMPQWVQASAISRISSDRADVAFLQLGYPDGLVAHIHVSWINPMKQRVIEVVGEKGMMVFDDVQVAEKLRIIDTGYDYPSAATEFGSFQLAVKSGDIVIPNIPYPEPLGEEVRAFAEAVNGKQTDPDTLQIALNTTKILSAIRSSLSDGGVKYTKA